MKYSIGTILCVTERHLERERERDIVHCWHLFELLQHTHDNVYDINVIKSVWWEKKPNEERWEKAILRNENFTGIDMNRWNVEYIVNIDNRTQLGKFINDIYEEEKKHGI